MPRPARRAATLVAAVLAPALAAPAQRSPEVPIAPRPGVGPLRRTGAPYAVAYTVAMPDPASHLYEVSVEFRGALPDTLRLELPVWSPGRYARVDFARNVQGFGAEDGAGRPLRWAKLGGSTWGVLTAGAPRATRTARVRYRVYANDLSGTYSVLDTAHANWNGAGLFVYAAGHKPDPVTLAVRAPAGWTVVNGPQGNPGYEAPAGADGAVRFTFPNYDEMIDAPTEVAPAGHVSVDTFAVDGRRYRVVLHHNGPVDSLVRRRLADGARRIVARENRVVAPPPLAQYTFLAHAGYGGGDGMEHLTSTEVITGRPLADTAAADRFLGTFAHEYFHTWNVKRLRPAALGPFDYTEAQHEPSLWVAEGWTQYYGEMTPVRVGIVPRAQFYAGLARTLQGVSTSPARLERSPRAASFDAPFFDGARAPMQTNAGATFVTYYVSGEARALALDLMLRAASDGRRSLDDVLRALKRRTWDGPRATYYLEGRGYTEADVERAASEVAGRDLHAWFERYVGGTEDLPWAELLAPLGLQLTTGEQWAVAEDPRAAPAQVALREGWLR